MNPLSWIYPPVCMACHVILPIQEHKQRLFRICPDCMNLLIRVPSPVCPKCGGAKEKEAEACPSCYGKVFNFSGNGAFFLYEGILRDILHDIKYRNRMQAALGLSELWAEGLGGIPNADVIVPVPMHPKKLRERGFNQAEVLARGISKKFKIPIAKNFLSRVVNTPPQSGLSARAREENVRGVFAVNKKFSAKDKEIIIIDDIFTTGVSLNECSSVLLKESAAKIYCMTLSITVKKSVIKNEDSDDKYLESFLPQ